MIIYICLIVQSRKVGKVEKVRRVGRVGRVRRVGRVGRVRRVGRVGRVRKVERVLGSKCSNCQNCWSYSKSSKGSKSSRFEEFKVRCFAVRQLRLWGNFVFGMLRCETLRRGTIANAICERKWSTFCFPFSGLKPIRYTFYDECVDFSYLLSLISYLSILNSQFSILISSLFSLLSSIFYLTSYLLRYLIGLI